MLCFQDGQFVPAFIHMGSGHVGSFGLLAHVEDLQAQDGQAVQGRAQGFGVETPPGLAQFPLGRKGGDGGDQPGVDLFHQIVALLVQAVDLALAGGDDRVVHIPPPGPVLDVPEQKIPEMLTQNQLD